MVHKLIDGKCGGHGQSIDPFADLYAAILATLEQLGALILLTHFLLLIAMLPSAAQMSGKAAATEPPSAAAACGDIPSTTARLPCGFLHTSGSQIVDRQNVPVRLVCVGWNGLNVKDSKPDGWGTIPLRQHLVQMITSGFNCIRIGWTDAGMNTSSMDYAKQIVAAAGTFGLRVIMDHHNNEGIGTGPGWGCSAQQQNGLWFDKGPGTDGTDGCGHRGTVTAQQFQQNWVTVAKMFAGNSTVIGMDLDNEPQMTGHITWGDGGVADIKAMCTDVGNAIEAVDPGVLIICPGVSNWSGSFAGGPATPEGDFSMVVSKPVVLKMPNQVVYTTHMYPGSIGGGLTTCGATAVERWNYEYGFLVTQNIAPVWVGEMGMTDPAADHCWARTIVQYLNGQTVGGLVIPAGGQGVGTSWWVWGTRAPTAGFGILEDDWVTPRPEMSSFYSQLRQKHVSHTNVDPNPLRGR
jgi:aryl-phospho-beta-D-glucosidase BglC (GH1 family)